MKTNKRKTVVAVLAVALLLMAACSPGASGPTPTPQACGDEWEAPVRDDSKNGAKIIAVGESQERSFDGAKDIDWVKTVLQAGWTYSIYTSDLGTSVDTSLAMEPGEGVKGGKTLTNDDDLTEPENAPASRIEVRIEVTGVYYIKVTNRLGLGGCGEGYGYRLTLSGAPIPTPTPTVTPTATAVSMPTGTPVATGLKVRWIDQLQKVEVLDGNTVKETWGVAELQRFCRDNGVIGQKEKLTAKAFASGKVGLQIVPESGNPQQTMWLRVGSLAGFEGLIVKADNAEKPLGAWQVTSSGQWKKVK